MRGHFLWTAPAVLGLLIFYSPASAETCWDGVVEQHEVGFDFSMLADVTGPDAYGVYTYVYRLYRVDQGHITYRSPSHISLQFECEGEAAADIILGGRHGLYLSGPGGPDIEVALDVLGFNEPGLGASCRTNGIKINFSDGVIVPDGDGVSYPADAGDPYLEIRFQSVAPPTLGHWFVKGGRKLSSGIPGSGDRPPVTFLTDGGSMLVPACRAPLPVLPSSWGRLKNMYQ